jgi:multidrug efflux pump subunit AcrA (membrane-fusion protein)
MIRRWLETVPLLALAAAGHAAGGPLLTGVVEDVDAQTIEMPSLPGGWQRRVEWMVQEGSQVEAGDVVVRLDPGDLIAQEDQARTDLEKQQLSAARRVDELRLAALDAQRAVAEAESAVRLASLDASVPASTIPRLDYDRYQLALTTARKELIRAEAQLLNAREDLADVIEETSLEVAQAEARYDRIRNALDATQIRAEKAGFMIYGDNPFNGRKVFPGETLHTGSEIALIASREDLQIRFWVHEADILDVRPGVEMLVIADAQGAQPFMAKLDWMSSQAVEREDWSDSGYFSAIAQPVDGVPDSIWPGMSVMGEVALPETDR